VLPANAARLCWPFFSQVRVTSLICARVQVEHAGAELLAHGFRRATLLHVPRRQRFRVRRVRLVEALDDADDGFFHLFLREVAVEDLIERRAEVGERAGQARIAVGT